MKIGHLKTLKLQKGNSLGPIGGSTTQTKPAAGSKEERKSETAEGEDDVLK